MRARAVFGAWPWPVAEGAEVRGEAGAEASGRAAAGGTGREKISACVITYNEEQKIARCLRSLSWCDEIVVLDSYSSDRTLEICRQFTDRIHQHEWMGYVGQRNIAREMATHPWILFLDADEEVSPRLRDEILREFRTGTGKTAGYEFPRLVYYLGRWILHGEWYPDVKLRLFRKEHGRSEGQEPHDRVEVNGPVRRLSAPIWHYTYDGIRDHLDTINRFSTITARQMLVAGKRFRWTDLLVRPVLRFLRGYLLRRGFRDGTPGLIIATINAYGVFVKYAKLWELWIRLRPGYRDLPEAAGSSARR
jgi:glycosyltransferase involved in cell wall biosynthesis